MGGLLGWGAKGMLAPSEIIGGGGAGPSSLPTPMVYFRKKDKMKNRIPGVQL